MKLMKFTKMEGSGNDFIVFESHQSSVIPSAGGSAFGGSRQSFIKKVCDRKFGVGADGVLLLEVSKKADTRMRIFNADGSEAEMCGNGARCVALYYSKSSGLKNISIETKAGLLEACVSGDSVRLKMTDPADLKLGLKVNVNGKEYEVDYINTGVPHTVTEVCDLKKIPVNEIGRSIRHHQDFAPAGTNVDFVKVKDAEHISVRTYERGVEDETLACGTGSVACAIIVSLNHASQTQKGKISSHKVFVATKSRETLCVYFRLSKYKVTDVWLEGKARIVFKGEY